MTPGNHTEDRIDLIDTRLREHGLRVTVARRGVYHRLMEASEPQSAAQIEAVLHAAGITIDLVTVYRTLETLERCSLVMRVDRLHEGWRYAVRSRQHSHSIVCSECGSATPLDPCGLRRIEQDLELTTGYSNISHSLQFFGTCPECRK
ncbi:MAG TPA: Fur family transcriptional regulator [Candidatus Kapabacteria bacterium]|nr:Fur family transcriptional regulator [Candidatus Kapabacteria bacterium]